MKVTDSLVRCPCCGNRQLSLSDVSDPYFESDGRVVSWQVGCPSCGLAWREYYAFTHSGSFVDDDGVDVEKPDEGWFDKNLF